MTKIKNNTTPSNVDEHLHYRIVEKSICFTVTVILNLFQNPLT